MDKRVMLKELLTAKKENAIRVNDLIINNKEKEKSATELVISNAEKAKLVDKLMHANEELAHQLDIHKKTENKLKQLIYKHKELIITKDKLFSIIAHDLRSPFTSILGFSELLIQNLETSSPENVEEFITHINNTAQNTLTLLDNLLSWARTQTGQIDFKPEKLQPRPTVAEIVGVLNSSAIIKNITLNNSVPGDTIAFADPNMLKTILRNLIQNAIKFTNTGGTVDILASRQQNHTFFAVSDNGIGMSEVTRNNLFKSDSTIIKNGIDLYGGSGLGLILCKEFVEKHGGKIWAANDRSKGSKFEFKIPLPIQ